MHILRIIWRSIPCCLLAAVFSCSKDEPADTENRSLAKFDLLNPDQTGITFQNTLEEGPNTNILMYEYFYNGGGVAAADFNADGLDDLYFTSNMGENKLYLNRGNMKFQDVTAAAGVSGRPGPWKTGAAAADINGDSRMDIYLCYSGALPSQKRVNQLFINQGNDDNGVPLFVESAQSYGLATPSFSNQAYFFDYDKDQDLDLLLLNHNPKSLPVLNEVSSKEMLKQDDPLRGVRLYQQINDRFVDVTLKAGISGSGLTYGLGIGISDLNNDGWPDFYVSNDYAVPDYLYINDQEGGFVNKASSSMGHTSHFSMGNDIADINNDLLPDIYTLDMLPEDNERQKLLLSPDNYEKFDLNLRSGFHYQYMRNMLQLNSGNGTYHEIGQLAGVSNTDWSWAALIADYDNDGWKDIFITNGYYRDYTNLDFINYMNDYTESKGRLTRNDVLEIIESMPSSNVTNYLFANLGGERFSNQTTSWGLDQQANSNGACYADLDNDGDLDLVVNNINQPAFVYENQSQNTGKNHYLKVALKGEDKNTLGLGARVTIHYNGRSQLYEQSTSRGYLSSVSPTLNFGLGQTTLIDSLNVLWNSGKQQILFDVGCDQTIELKESEAALIHHTFRSKSNALFKPVLTTIAFENPKISVNDFKRQSLLISQLSYSGPVLNTWDFNMDGLNDLIIGGAKGQSAALYIQQKDGSFKEDKPGAFSQDINCEDTGICVFDANGDNYPDLYIASGGYHDYRQDDPRLQDRLYINDGSGDFTKSQRALPAMTSSKGCVAANDIDNDGDPDVFVGGRVIPGRYPETPRSYLLINDGNGVFTDQTSSMAPDLVNLGMVTDAKWVDLNNDSVKELVVVGEWLPITVFSVIDGRFENQTSRYFTESYSGWWNNLEIADLNGDNRPDLIAGNIGTNTQVQVSKNEPAEMYFRDFDENGSVDPIFCFFIQGKSYPYITRDELLRQLVYLRPQFTSYESYAGATINDIFSQEELVKAKRLAVNHLETTLFYSQSDGSYRLKELPIQAQYAPVCSIQVHDFTGDNHPDILLLGNNHHFKLRLGKSDANHGVLLVGDGSGNFEYMDQPSSGLNIRGAVKSSVLINDLLILGINQQPITTYSWNKTMM